MKRLPLLLCAALTACLGTSNEEFPTQIPDESVGTEVAAVGQDDFGCPQHCAGNCYGGSPLLVDMTRDNFLDTVPYSQGVYFDIASTGFPNKPLIGWTRSGMFDGFLALDRNNNHVIDNGGELFGWSTPQAMNSALPANQPNGFIALQMYDTNGDGWIDFTGTADPIQNELLFWVDRNHDGMTQGWLADVPGQPYTQEIFKVKDWFVDENIGGTNYSWYIKRIATNYTNVGNWTMNGNKFWFVGAIQWMRCPYHKRSTTQCIVESSRNTVWDVYFGQDPNHPVVGPFPGGVLPTPIPAECAPNEPTGHTPTFEGFNRQHINGLPIWPGYSCGYDLYLMPIDVNDGEDFLVCSGAMTPAGNFYDDNDWERPLFEPSPFNQNVHSWRQVGTLHPDSLDWQTVLAWWGLSMLPGYTSGLTKNAQITEYNKVFENGLRMRDFCRLVDPLGNQVRQPWQTASGCEYTAGTTLDDAKSLGKLLVERFPFSFGN